MIKYQPSAFSFIPVSRGHLADCEEADHIRLFGSASCCEVKIFGEGVSDQFEAHMSMLEPDHLAAQVLHGILEDLCERI